MVGPSLHLFYSVNVFMTFLGVNILLVSVEIASDDVLFPKMQKINRQTTKTMDVITQTLT